VHIVPIDKQSGSVTVAVMSHTANETE